MGASRYMAVEAFTDEQSGRTFAPGDMVTGGEYERMGDPESFRPAEFPEQVDALRAAHGIDVEPDPVESAAPPPEDGLDGLTVDQLRELAAEHDIEGRSSMNKAQLLEALRAQ